MAVLGEAGFKIHRSVFESHEVSKFRDEADRLSAAAGSASVRMLTERSELFRNLASSDGVKELIGGECLPVRSILFDKTSKENWPVLWHQDLTIAVREEREVNGYSNWSCKDKVPHVQPPLSVLENMVTVRIHLDSTPESNGALRVVSGSHLYGRVSPDSIPGIVESGEERVCECQAGDVLLMSPLILHSSRRSRNPSRRRVLHFEYAKPDSLAENLEWYEGEKTREKVSPNDPKNPDHDEVNRDDPGEKGWPDEDENSGDESKNR